MTATLVDTNVLIDLAVRDPRWLAWSRTKLFEAWKRGAVVINQTIYAEFSYRYRNVDDVEMLLPDTEFRREGLPWAAGFAAARAFRHYRLSGGRRDRVPPDFFIGAHAAVRGYAILTRDPDGYRRYFPTIDLIAPDTHP